MSQTMANDLQGANGANSANSVYLSPTIVILRELWLDNLIAWLQIFIVSGVFVVICQEFRNYIILVVIVMLLLSLS